MDSSDIARKPVSSGVLFRDTDLFGKVYADFDFVKHWTCSRFVKSEGFEPLVKAITRGDQSLTDQILRRWGVR